MIWFVIALGLFCRDAYRQVYRWLVPWKKNDVPGRSTLCMARQRLGPAPLMQLARRVVRLLATPQTPGAFPQVQVLGLVECGTHVFWRWQIKPCHVGETTMAPPLLRHLQAGMLLMWDRGF